MNSVFDSLFQSTAQPYLDWGMAIDGRYKLTEDAEESTPIRIWLKREPLEPTSDFQQSQTRRYRLLVSYRPQDIPGAPDINNLHFRFPTTIGEDEIWHVTVALIKNSPSRVQVEVE